MVGPSQVLDLGLSRQKAHYNCSINLHNTIITLQSQCLKCSLATTNILSLHNQHDYMKCKYMDISIHSLEVPLGCKPGRDHKTHKVFNIVIKCFMIKDDLRLFANKHCNVPIIFMAISIFLWSLLAVLILITGFYVYLFHQNNCIQTDKASPNSYIKLQKWPLPKQNL